MEPPNQPPKAAPTAVPTQKKGTAIKKKVTAHPASTLTSTLRDPQRQDIVTLILRRRPATPPGDEERTNSHRTICWGKRSEAAKEGGVEEEARSGSSIGSARQDCEARRDRQEEEVNVGTEDTEDRRQQRGRTWRH